MPSQPSQQPDCQWWLSAIQDVLGSYFQQRKLPREIKYGSDCSGVDAPVWGLSQLLSNLQAADGEMTVTLTVTQ